MRIQSLQKNLIGKAALLLVVLLIAPVVKGQDRRFQIWTDFNARFELQNRLEINVEPGYRIEPNSGIQTGYLRGSFRYSPIRLISIDGGIANFNVWGRRDQLNSSEFRTFEYLRFNLPELLGFRFRIRMGLEQRWFWFTDIEATEFVHRARLRFGLTSPYFDFWEGPAKLFLRANFELLRDVNDETIDVLINENRIMLGFGFLDNKRFRGEVHYQVMGLRDRAAGEFFGDTNLIRFRVYYYIRSNQS